MHVVNSAHNALHNYRISHFPYRERATVYKMFDSVLITLVDKPRAKSGVRHALEEFGLDFFVSNLRQELSIKEITGSVSVFQKDVLV